MYDTINLRLRQDDLKEVLNFMDVLSQYLSDVISINANDNVWIKGCLGNLTITANHYQMSVRDGSLCKWYLGDNLKTMTRTDTMRAIEKLSDILHLPIARADVTRLDVAANIMTKYPISVYLKYLGALRYYKRLEEPDGLYYSQSDKRLCFYDKVKEQRKRHNDIPELYADKNVLRIEYRIKQRVSKHLNTEVKASTLYDKEFHSRIVNEWYKMYMDIKKISEINPDLGALMVKFSPTKALSLMYIREHGVNEIISHIEILRKKKLIRSDTASRYNKQINDLNAIDDDLLNTPDTILELNQKVAEAVRIYG